MLMQFLCTFELSLALLSPHTVMNSVDSQGQVHERRCRKPGRERSD
jgi:hypothetical protein